MTERRAGSELAYWRMHNLGLWSAGSPSVATAEKVVHRMGAVQSQDFGAAKWAVAQRLDRATNSELDAEFAAGRILRTHVLRPTWHFVLPADLRWLLQLTAPRVHALNAYYYRQEGLDERVLTESAALLADELQGGRQLTRIEVAEVLEKAGITARSIRLGYILINAELNGVICSGAPRGKQQTYALLDDRAPDSVNLSQEQALAELTVRYFTSHGPATAKDFRWWSSLTLSQIQQGLELVGSRLQREVVDDMTLWFGQPPPESTPPSPTIHLLQAYDEYIVGYSESKYLLDLSGAVRSQPATAGTFNHVMLLDGQVMGRWRQILNGDSVAVEVTTYRPLTAAEREALKSAAEAYGRFLAVSASVVLHAHA